MAKWSSVRVSVVSTFGMRAGIETVRFKKKAVRYSPKTVRYKAKAVRDLFETVRAF